MLWNVGHFDQQNRWLPTAKATEVPGSSSKTCWADCWRRASRGGRNYYNVHQSFLQNNGLGKAGQSALRVKPLSVLHTFLVVPWMHEKCPKMPRKAHQLCGLGYWVRAVLCRAGIQIAVQPSLADQMHASKSHPLITHGTDLNLKDAVILRWWWMIYKNWRMPGHKLINVHRKQANSMIILAKKWTVKIPAVVNRMIFSCVCPSILQSGTMHEEIPTTENWPGRQDLQVQLEAIQGFCWSLRVPLKSSSLPHKRCNWFVFHKTNLHSRKCPLIHHCSTILCRYKWACWFQSNIHGGIWCSSTCPTRCPEISVLSNYSSMIVRHTPWSPNKCAVTRWCTEMHQVYHYLA